MEFGGLHIVSSGFYQLILRLEYVFVVNLLPTTLAILRSAIIQKVYITLKESLHLRTLLEDLLSEAYTEEVIMNLTTYICTTYCRMRGKDFCWQMIARDFNNLGKSLWSKLAVLSDRNSYSKKERVTGDMHELFSSVTEEVSNDDDEITANDQNLL